MASRSRSPPPSFLQRLMRSVGLRRSQPSPSITRRPRSRSPTSVMINQGLGSTYQEISPELRNEIKEFKKIFRDEATRKYLEYLDPMSETPDKLFSLLNVNKSASDRILQFKLLNQSWYHEINNFLMLLSKGTDNHTFPEMVKTLLLRGADPNYETDYNTPLLVAIGTRNNEVIRLLLEAGADPNYEKLFTSPLFEAIRTRNNDAISMLLEAGADVNRDLSRAIDVVDVNTLRKLIDYANPQALFNSLYGVNNEEKAKLLLQTGISPEPGTGSERLLQLINQESPLFNAVRHGYTDVVKVLLEAGANPERINSQGLKPINYTNDRRISELLFKYSYPHTRPRRQYVGAKRALTDVNREVSLTPAGGPSKTLEDVLHPRFPRFPGGDVYRQTIAESYSIYGEEPPQEVSLNKKLTPSPIRSSSRSRSPSPTRSSKK